MAAGFDLHSLEDVEVHPGSTKLIDTKVGVILPPGTYGRVAPRSSMSFRGILIGAGVIDRDFTGSIAVVLHNISHFKYWIKKGDRIGQLIIEKVHEGLAQVRFDRPDETTRGAKGFGSTGK